jgi:nucleotide-binding universal stress UspA family protein
MSCKTITVCLNEIAAVPRLLEATRALAQRYDAHVRGLYVIPAIQIYGDTGFGTVPVVFDAARLFFEKEMPGVKQKFEAAMKEDGTRFEFQAVQSEVPDITYEVIENSRSSDLIIVASKPESSGDDVEDGFVERLIIGSGRPVLVVPRKGKAAVNTENVMVAWDGSREATRAVFDALPLLKGSKRVDIVSIDSKLDGTVPGASIAEVLDRHGLKTEVIKASAEGMTTGEAVLRAAADRGSGLLVMGCYGHGRFSEFVFGGATRFILANLERPVLMSH